MIEMVNLDLAPFFGQVKEDTQLSAAVSQL